MLLPHRNLRLINLDMTLIFRQQIQALRGREIAGRKRAGISGIQVMSRDWRQQIFELQGSS